MPKYIVQESPGEHIPAKKWYYEYSILLFIPPLNLLLHSPPSLSPPLSSSVQTLRARLHQLFEQDRRNTPTCQQNSPGRFTEPAWHDGVGQQSLKPPYSTCVRVLICMVISFPYPCQWVRTSWRVGGVLLCNSESGTGECDSYDSFALFVNGEWKARLRTQSML